AAAVAIGGASAVTAEDVDIFTASPGTVAKPNVLIFLDNSSNWSATLGANSCNTGNMAASTKFAAELCALKLVLQNIPDNSVRLGLMMIAESGNNGAYIRFAMRDMNANNKTAFTN